MKSSKRKIAALALAIGVAAPLLTATSANALGSSGLAPTRHTANYDDYNRVDLYCSNGNFSGNVNVGYRWSRDTGAWVIDVQTYSYNIERRNGQSGGNKANIDIGLDSYVEGRPDHHDFGWVKSPDSMKQDGVTHDLDLRHRAITARTPTWKGYITLSAKFTFDKSGHDPSCRRNIDLVPPV